MINKDNLKDLLKTLGFVEKANVFSKYFPENPNAFLKVDFKKKELIYPTSKGFIVNGEFTCNFKSDENFVVFECVNRLFEKGYKPEHIELEPKWKVGHGASGGRADILIKDNSSKSLLIIECKTEGHEFKKEWNNTLQRGGQMLTYAKQAGTTQYVCLYASDFTDGKVITYQYIISLKDNKKLLEELADKKPLSFKEAKSLEVEDIYKAWKETYNLDFATKGIFEDDIQPYQIGKQKYTVKDLVEVGSKDIQSKYHEFATIMRQHNVSGRENAFDKLVNLFLCKIVDEAKNPKDLKFNWKGIAYDSYFDLQDRLQLLYQAGMKEFLGEEVTYIDNTAIDKAFRFFKKDPDATRETIKNYFRQLKFFTNNDFAFIDVHNEKLFYQNSEVLLKIVLMLQDIKLQENSTEQFLGDMFEGFLDNGVKQSEGQYFTPMPIVKFILNCLPLESIIQESELPPKSIDFACGAGHFLNELALQIKPYVEEHKETEVIEYYKEIIGIEKEYRLSKVAKVSAFMYGQDEIKIKYADALGNKAKIQDNEYSILVANPPYSVKGFLQTLTEVERKNFTLLDTIDEKTIYTNNSIECFFIEKAKQLLKPNAVAGIILPPGIINTENKIYTKTREIILEYFDIVSIVEFSTQTFGKTGTNTVTLFLRRKEENPASALHWKNRVISWFTDDKAEAVYKDNNKIKKYCNHIDVEFDHYKSLLTGKPTEQLLKTEIFIDYKNAFDNLTEIKNLKKPKSAFSKKTEKQQEIELKKRFVAYLQEIEKDKLYYYVLASENKQKVLIVKCPKDNKKQKQFLGYEWSGARESPGIKYINQNIKVDDIVDEEAKEIVVKLKGLKNINTPLYNPNNRNDKTKINYHIEQNFKGQEIPVSENLSEFISYHNLVDMLDFTGTVFNKPISLTPKKNTLIQSKWDSVRLEKVAKEFFAGGDAPKTNFSKEKTSKYKVPIYSNGVENKGLYGYTVKPVVNEPCVTISARGTLGYTEIRLQPFVPIVRLIVIVPNDLINLNYLQIALNKLDFTNSGSVIPQLTIPKVKKLKIPLPPLDIQNLLVDECKNVDSKVEKAIKAIEKAENEISKIVNSKLINGDSKKLKDLIEINKFSKDPRKEPNKEFIYVDIESVDKGTGIVNYDQKILGSNAPSRARRIAPVNSTIISTVRPNLRGFTFKSDKIECIYSTGFAILQSKDEEILNNKVIYYSFMYSTALMKEMSNTMHGGSYPSLNKKDIENFKIPVPSIEKQREIIKEIDKLEKRKITNQKIINSATENKDAIIEKHL